MKESARVMVMEAETAVAAVLGDCLRAAGHSPLWIAHGEEAMDAFRSWKPDLVLLDLLLPGNDGMALCRQMRGDRDMPVIMMAARAEEAECVMALEVGADDYICKPFSAREVVARVGVVLRRYRHRTPALPVGLAIDEPCCKATLHGQWLALTPVEFRLLRTLARSPGRIWPREVLMDHLYPDQRIVTGRTVDSHVKNLRRKLIDAGAGNEAIVSIYGVGYRFAM